MPNLRAMKKTWVSLSALAFALIGATAHAAPTKGSFSAQLLPFPKLAAVGDPVGLTQPGCLAGQEDVHWAAEPFSAPKKGTLSATTEGFTGDFDLYILDEAGFRSSGARTTRSSTRPRPRRASRCRSPKVKRFRSRSATGSALPTSRWITSSRPPRRSRAQGPVTLSSFTISLPPDRARSETSPTPGARASRPRSAAPGDSTRAS